ncbi:MAG: motility protein A [Oscillospiraceae bacterium]|jgi:chemotaxis protein MotA|nr:motility protein A [Oscillospiraceae bacterium]
MEITTLLGMILCFVFLVISMYWGGGDVFMYLDVPSAFIVILGSIAAVFASYSLSDFFRFPQIIGNAFKHSSYDSVGGINTIVSLANIARKEGMLALEERVGELNDDYLKKGIMLVVDGTDPELVKNIMEAELGSIESRHQKGVGMVELLGAVAPAFGMMGTVIGLVIMMGRMEDPTALGAGMATALITTFYGSMIANIISIPIATKLKRFSADEIMYKEILLEGLLSIQAGENPRIIEEKLYSFLPRSAKEAPKPQDAIEE